MLEEDVKEFEESEESIREKVGKIVDLINLSKCTALFTGAGISTSAGIPDFRGPKGVWTLSKQGKAVEGIKRLEELEPTKCHMVLKTLLDNQKIKYVISQNVDGLLLKAGIPPHNLAELHGNCFIEECWGCEQKYIRNYDTCDDEQAFAGQCASCIANKKKMCHCTPRHCTKCGEYLKDSLIHFGESLHPHVVQSAGNKCLSSDLMICAGSSLSVFPACDYPKDLKQRGGKLVIINKQKTELDWMADVHIFGDIDKIFGMIAEGLGLEVLEYSPVNSMLIPTDESSFAKVCVKTNAEHVWSTSPPCLCATCSCYATMWCDLCEQCGLCAGVE